VASVSWQLVHEPAEDKADTSLRFTDVLFGFVIKELFTRLSDWSMLTATARAHLIAGSVLVLGSYIGFRKSLNRDTYKLSFFNLPLWRFILDQAMVVLYFRFATVTEYPMPPAAAGADLALVRVDSSLLAWVFALYVAWDGLSWWMASTKYPVKDRGVVKPYRPGRLLISLAGFIAFLAMRCWAMNAEGAAPATVGMEVAAIGVLLVYRVLKDAYV